MTLAALHNTAHVLGNKTGKPAPVDRALVFLTVLTHSLSVDQSGDRQGGISVHAIAESFERPFETTRRHVGALLDGQWCVRVRTGIAIPPDLLDGAAGGIARHIHDLLIWLAEQFRALDLPLPATRAAEPAPAHAATLAALELVLAAIDFSASGYRTMREFYIVNAIMAGSVRDVTFTPALSRQFAAISTIPGDRHRAGINVTRLARTLGLPTVTTYRYVNHGLAIGRLERHRGGVRATAEFLASPRVRADIRTAFIRAERAFHRLAQTGFPFDAPATRYLDRRPTLPDWRG